MVGNAKEESVEDDGVEGAPSKEEDGKAVELINGDAAFWFVVAAVGEVGVESGENEKGDAEAGDDEGEFATTTTGED